MQKCTDETLVNSGDGKRGNRKIEVLMNEGKREKIVLKFTRSLILGCEKEDYLMKRWCEWKVSTPSNSQTNTVKENVEENKSVAANRPGSTDNEKLVTVVDVSDPWSVINEGKTRKLKVNKMAGLRLPRKIEKKAANMKPNKTELAKTKVIKKDEVLLKSLFVVGKKASCFKKSKNSFTNYKAGLKRLRSKRCTKENQTSACIQKKVTLQKLFVVGKKTSLKKYPKNSFRDYRAYKAGLKRYTSNRGIEQNEIVTNFQIKKARKRL